MAFDQTTRNRLQKFVSEARKVLTEEFTRQLQSIYGIDPESASISPLDRLQNLDDARRETAKILRATLDHYRTTNPTEDTKSLLDRIVREHAFTILNRLAALRMAEARGLLIESLAQGYNSKGFQLYARVAGTGLGEKGDAYRCYLLSLFDEFALDLRVLFDRFSPTGRLFPREASLLEVLGLMNDAEVAPLWAEDETIGWIYQYFNSKEERKKMRDESAAPRNSRELAVRNQFFTPRYVVEFLTDNTLGRIWYEMTKGETGLKEQCRYLVRRPTEIFLKPGEEAPPAEESAEQNLSQEELLKQPVHIPHRPLRDPRAIRVLDPACGSMHFGLYAFDLLAVIYDEAWELEAVLGAQDWQREPGDQPLREKYADKEALLRDVPRLIIERNLHGIDIDPRAVQIAGLSLWLRAQRAWQKQGLKPADRPQVRRSNIVCAEPMPGEEALLSEFIERHLSAVPELRLVAQLVRRVFRAMKLAGEAGSLLKIEEEVAGAVAEAKAQWQDENKAEDGQGSLFADLAKHEQQRLAFEVAEITDETFWERAESNIYKALREYAEQVDNGGGYQRRLFAEDAARGFAFIDVCRNRYDVVLMNPPFGDASSSSLFILDDQLSVVGRDVGAAFLKAGVMRFASGGITGALLPTGFWFKPVFENLRDDLFWGLGTELHLGAHLGGQVLDGATVNASPIVVAKSNGNSSLVFRCVDLDDNDIALTKGISAIEAGANLPSWVFNLKPKTASVLPGKPFSYWLSSSLRSRLSKLPPFEGFGGTVKQGTATADEFRFCRAWWEVKPAPEIWSTFTKSSEFSPFWDELPWLLKTSQRLKEIDATGKARVQGVSFFGRAGVTFPRKSIVGFNPRLQLTGCAFGDSAPIAFPEKIHPLALLSVLTSRPVEYLIGLFIGELQGEAGVYPLHYQVGVVARLPWPGLKDTECQLLMNVATAAAHSLQELESFSETSRLFKSVANNLRGIGLQLHEQVKECEAKAMANILSARDSADEVVFNAYGFDDSDIDDLRKTFSELIPPASGKWRQYFGVDGSDVKQKEVVGNLVSWLIGTVLGYWDIRFATGEKPSPELPNPIAPLPICPPGMLQNEQGLPAAPSDVPADYPLRISWPGILVDDKGHAEDMERRSREALNVIWKDRADAIEQEACEILGVKTPRDYFRKPAGFFADHLQRYSKSRRQAPIYWPLSTKSGGYTLWLYYHRLNDQTLYSCVNNFIEPKLKNEITPLVNQLRAKGANRSRDEDKEFERLQDFELELQELRDELLRLAQLPWRPNLNDGVQITAAPLWSLFRLPKWQKTLKETWGSLEKGDYDWAHLAMTIWPARVVPKCTKDRSLAIAHDVEDLFWVEDVSGWRALQSPQQETKTQIERQRSAARERVRQLLAEFAQGNTISATDIGDKLAAGAFDDRDLTLLLYPTRMAEVVWESPVLAQRLNIKLPPKKTKAARDKFIKEIVNKGCGEVGTMLEAALSGRAKSFAEVWAELERGDHDDLALALALWPERVVEKCTKDVTMAETQGLRKFFWVQHPGDAWRKRISIEEEITNEVARRRGVPTSA